MWLDCQAKTKGSQKITFAEFERALELVAEKKVWLHALALLTNVAAPSMTTDKSDIMQGCSADDLKSKICSASGPKTQATTPDYVKFHDDKV